MDGKPGEGSMNIERFGGRVSDFSPMAMGKQAKVLGGINHQMGG